MGGSMSKILPGLYVGNFRDAKDVEALKANGITHILSIHDNAKKLLDDKEYLIIIASDNPYEHLIKYFPRCIDFIHKARLSGGGVLVHCLAGVSRSVTVTAAYLMTATSLSWREALNAIRGARNHANPNFGFQKQLQEYENSGLEEAREKFKADFVENDFDDEATCRQLLQSFKHYVLTGESMATPRPFSATPSHENDGLYPLPHNAYAAKRQSALDPDGEACSSSEHSFKTPESSSSGKLAVSADATPSCASAPKLSGQLENEESKVSESNCSDGAVGVSQGESEHIPE